MLVSFPSRSIYHFDPSNLPPGKLQIPNVSPATSPLPVDNTNAQNRKKNRINVTEEHPTTDDKENRNSAPENSRSRSLTEIETTPESQVTMPESTKTISMNSLLSPLSKVYSETKDKNRIITGMCLSIITIYCIRQRTTTTIPTSTLFSIHSCHFIKF